jgi:nucleotide-binding universal stress UspA family protein
VSEAVTPLVIRRILVAVDASPQSNAALDMAARLAATMQAELCGLFVEDVNLLRMAEAPSAREIAYPGKAAPTSRASMERTLKARSEQIRNTVAAVAHRAKVPWSFRSVRGHVTTALRSAISEHDMIAIGRIGWSFGRRMRIGSTALELVTSSIPLLLISQGAVLGKLRLLVCYDGTLPSRNALLFAVKLATAGANGLTVLVRAADYEKELPEIRRLLEGLTLEVRCERIELDETASLLRAVKQEGSILLILAGRQLLNDRKAFETLLRELDLPLLLLGDGYDRSELESSCAESGEL